jgi:hypothetical protein
MNRGLTHETAQIQTTNAQEDEYTRDWVHARMNTQACKTVGKTAKGSECIVQPRGRRHVHNRGSTRPRMNRRREAQVLQIRMKANSQNRSQEVVDKFPRYVSL